MKKFLIVGIIAIIAVSVWYYIRHPIGEKAIINGRTIYLELAVTEAEKERGLGFRDSLPADHGMLFVFQTKNRYGFWMKDMKFPLDFVWIDGTKIVELSEHVLQPADDTVQPVSLSPWVPVDKVLEVNAGMIESLGIKVGDTVRFTN